jgi:hypothetical protein
VLERDPNHAKVLQQLGWLHHQQSSNYASQEQAIEYLEKSVASGKFGIPLHKLSTRLNYMIRSNGRTELVLARTLLHVTAEVP